MKLLAIIPAKLDSTRLLNKNIQKINGKTLIEHSIEYAKKSKHQIDVIVSSESDTVEDIISGLQVTFHKRNQELCGDTEVVDVYLDIVSNLTKEYDLVIGLQPDNPDRSHSLDECIDYMLENNYDDLITVNEKYKRSGSVRIFKYKYLKQGQVSKRLGCIKDLATDIHYQQDLEKVTQKIFK